jgi:hypothetical protein
VQPLGWGPFFKKCLNAFFLSSLQSTLKNKVIE